MNGGVGTPAMMLVSKKYVVEMARKEVGRLGWLGWLPGAPLLNVYFMILRACLLFLNYLE